MAGGRRGKQGKREKTTMIIWRDHSIVIFLIKTRYPLLITRERSRRNSSEGPNLHHTVYSHSFTNTCCETSGKLK